MGRKSTTRVRKKHVRGCTYCGGFAHEKYNKENIGAKELRRRNYDRIQALKMAFN